jgi:uncharacterized protein (TIGR02246 family)
MYWLFRVGIGCVLMGVILLGPAGCSKRVAEEKTTPKSTKKDAKPASPEEAIRATAAAYVKAYNAADAKALASLWTPDGELITDEDSLQGRDAIQAAYSTFFKENKGLTAEVQITSLRPLARQTVIEEGTLLIRQPGEKEPIASRYSALHVLTDEGWKMASVREVIPNPAEFVSLKDAEKLIGSWNAKSGKSELRLAYAWDENKTFIRGSYAITVEGKPSVNGTQIIARGHQGELRSWQFDSTGAVGEWLWWREGDHWTIEATETLPSGAVLTTVHYLVPLNNDAFLWHTTQRNLNEVELPDLPPLKVERTKPIK